MSYEKIGFISNEILTADQLNHMEDGIERSGLPANPGAYKQLSTDGDGNVVWEDKLFGQVSEITDFWECFVAGPTSEGTLENGYNFQQISQPNIEEYTHYYSVYGLLTGFPIYYRTSYSTGSEKLLQKEQAEFVADGLKYIGYKLFDPDNDTFYLLSGHLEVTLPNLPSDTSLICWQERKEPYIFLSAKLPTNKPIPAEYLPVSRIVFTYDGTSYTCNVPFEQFGDAVINGLPISYVDKQELLTAYYNATVRSVSTDIFDVAIFDGAELVTQFGYTPSGFLLPG